MSVFAKVVCMALAALAMLATQASAAVPHTVIAGETLWSIAAANNFTTDSLAAYNGLSPDAQVYVGETIQIPTADEASSALAGTGSTSTSPTTSTATTTPAVSASTAVSSPPPEEHPSWTSPIYCPSCPNGEAYLASNAAYNWNAMRQASLSTYGIDLYPAGALSAYRSYGQQLYLYDLYLSGQGSLAAPPGTSSHEYGSAIDLADPAMATVIDEIGATYGWAKTEAPGEWWHVNYFGP